MYMPHDLRNLVYDRALGHRRRSCVGCTTTMRLPSDFRIVGRRWYFLLSRCYNCHSLPIFRSPRIRLLRSEPSVLTLRSPGRVAWPANSNGELCPGLLRFVNSSRKRIYLLFSNRVRYILSLVPRRTRFPVYFLPHVWNPIVSVWPTGFHFHEVWEGPRFHKSAEPCTA